MNEANPACVDAEELALFVEGRLEGDARARVIRHVGVCDECSEAVRAVSRVVMEVAPRPVAPFRRKPAMALGLLALAASVLLAVSVNQWGPPQRRSAYEQLVVAFETTRPAQGRLAGFPHGALTVTRGTATPSSSWQILAAAAKIRELAADRPTADNLHALGIAHLALGEPDAAIRALRDAAEQAPGVPAIQNDLSVAYAARAVRAGNAEDLAQSLAAADRAIAADPGIAEAYFNRALALESLALIAEARAAWQAYLDRDPDGPWAAEAREHLIRRRSDAPAPFPSMRPQLDGALTDNDRDGIRAIVDAYPLAVRDYLSDDLLPRWAAAVMDRSDPAWPVATASRLVDVMAARSPDRAPVEMLERITAASTAQNARQRLALLHRTYAMARQAQAGDSPAEASRIFAACASTEPNAHPLALECSYGTTATALNGGDRERARRLLRHIAATAEARGYLHLRGMTRWRLALLAGMDGDLAGALTEYRQALAIFREARSTDFEANVHSLISEILRLLGDIPGAWREHQLALSLSAELWSPRIRHQILRQTVLTSLASGLPAVALDVTATLIAEDLAWGHQPSLALAYADRARALTVLGRQDEALSALDLAHRTASLVPDPDYQRRFETDLLAARVAVFAGAQPREALAAAERGVDNVEQIGSVPLLPSFLFARARARAALGEIIQAERDYVTALKALENERARLAPDSLRLSHMERSLAVVRSFAEFQLSVRHDPLRALEVIEQSRARWLLAAARGVAARPITPRMAMDVIPADTAVIYFAVLGGGLHSWVIADRRVTHRRMAVSMAGVDASVRHLWEKLELGADVGNDLAGLHAVLLAPLHDLIGDRARLVLVPDGAIYSVPLPALIDRDSNRYLVERTAVVVSPSLTLASLEEPRPIGARIASVGIFGGNVKNAPFLPEVMNEQHAVAAAYHQVTRRYDGGKQEFLLNIDRHDVVHFTGHAVANAEDPGLSRLSFPTVDELPTGDVLATEISALHLRRVRFVVLAACRTASGRNAAGEGMLSLAHAFLGAGASAVLGSLWDIDDRATRTLMTWVHEEMARGQSPVEALRHAQLRALASGDAMLRHPSRWAAFIAVARS